MILNVEDSADLTLDHISLYYAWLLHLVYENKCISGQFRHCSKGEQKNLMINLTKMNIAKVTIPVEDSYKTNL